MGNSLQKQELDFRQEINRFIAYGIDFLYYASDSMKKINMFTMLISAPIVAEIVFRGFGIGIFKKYGMGLYDDYEGEILITGIELRQINKKIFTRYRRYML